MATEFTAKMPVISASDQIEGKARRRNFEHRFFLTVAILFPVINIIGYAQTYYFKPLFSTPPLPSALVHIHASVMTVWMGYYLLQTSLVTSKRVRVHMTMGIAGLFLAAVVVVVGMMTAYAMLARGASLPGLTPEEFFIIPVGDMFRFVTLLAAAVYLRKRPADHKRLMLLTVLNFLPPALSRLPFQFVIDMGALWYIGVPVLLSILLLAADAIYNRRLNKVFAGGVAFLVGTVFLEMWLGKTEAWTQFVRSLL